MGGTGRATGVYNDKCSSPSLHWDSPPPFTPTASSPKGHPVLWVLPRTEGVPRTWTFSFKSKTMQGRPDAYPTQHLPPGRVPLWGPSLHAFQSRQSEPFKMQTGAGNSAAFRVSLAPRPGLPLPCLTSSTLPLAPYPSAPAIGHHARPQAGVD